MAQKPLKSMLKTAAPQNFMQPALYKGAIVCSEHNSSARTMAATAKTRSNNDLISPTPNNKTESKGKSLYFPLVFP